MPLNDIKVLVVDDSAVVRKVLGAMLESAPGIRLLHGALKLASTAPVRTLAARLFGGPGKAPDLSRYS